VNSLEQFAIHQGAMFLGFFILIAVAYLIFNALVGKE
jgi:hypothetical protein